MDARAGWRSISASAKNRRTRTSCFLPGSCRLASTRRSTVQNKLFFFLNLRDDILKFAVFGLLTIKSRLPHRARASIGCGLVHSLRVLLSGNCTKKWRRAASASEISGPDKGTGRECSVQNASFENPSETTWCDCGYNFPAGEVSKKTSSEPAQGLPGRSGDRGILLRLRQRNRCHIHRGSNPAAAPGANRMFMRLPPDPLPVELIRGR